MLVESTEPQSCTDQTAGSAPAARATRVNASSTRSAVHDVPGAATVARPSRVSSSTCPCRHAWWTRVRVASSSTGAG